MIESLTDISAISFAVEKTFSGENAKGSHQQLHRAAQSHPGEGVSQAGAKLQAGES